jgi:hypothetical protein
MSKEIRCRIKYRDSVHKETGGVIYDYVCYDPETGQEFNRIPVASEMDVQKVCGDDIKCKKRYLGLLLRLVLEKSSEAWNELKKFHKERQK